MKREIPMDLMKRAKRRDADAFTELMQSCMKDMYRVSYDRQADDHTWINVCGEKKLSSEEFELTFGDVNDLETYAAQTAKLVDDILITCTVQYTDGTTQDAQIKMGTTIMSYEQAGQKSENPSDKDVFLTFELQ